MNAKILVCGVVVNKGKKVLMVGSGGIGCELLKTLAFSGFQDIHIAAYLYVVNSSYPGIQLVKLMHLK